MKLFNHFNFFLPPTSSSRPSDVSVRVHAPHASLSSSTAHASASRMIPSASPAPQLLPGLTVAAWTRFFSGRLSLCTSSHTSSPMISSGSVLHFVSRMISSSRISSSFHRYNPHSPYPSKRHLEPHRSIPNIEQRR